MRYVFILLLCLYCNIAIATSVISNKNLSNGTLPPCTAQDAAALRSYDILEAEISESLTPEQSASIRQQLGGRDPEAVMTELTDTPQEIEALTLLMMRCGG